MKRPTRWLARLMIGAMCAGAPDMARAQPSAASEEAYQTVQGAFLREDFSAVVREARQWLAHDDTLTSQRARVWLWEILSLDRLERRNEALRELDRLKAELPTLAAAQANALWPEVLFWEGELSRHAARWGRAQAAYKRLLAAYPASTWRAAAHFGWGTALFQEQAFEQAAQQFREAGRLAADTAFGRSARLMEAACALQRQQFEEALGLSWNIAASAADPEQRAQALVYQGQALTGLSRFDDAAAAFQQAQALQPPSQWTALAYFGLGWSAFQQHQCAQSLQALQGYAAHGGDVSRPEALLIQGRCAVEQGDWARGMAALQQIIATQPPAHPMALEARLGLAEALQGRREWAQAETLLADVRAAAPAFDNRVRLQLGSLYVAQGRAEEAIAQLEDIPDTENLPLLQAARLGLGDAWMASGDLETAMLWYQEAMRTAPESELGLLAAYRLGRARLESGASADAQALFELVVKRAPWPAAAVAGPRGALKPVEQLALEARLALALADLADGRVDEARVHAEWIRSQAPGSPQATRAEYALAWMAVQAGALQEARVMCERVVAAAPDTEEGLEAGLLLAEMARREFRLSEAMVWYERAADLAPQRRGQLDYQIASCYEEGGDITLAIHRYRAITLAPWAVRGELAAAKLLEREERWAEAEDIYRALARESIPEAKLAAERLAALQGVAGE